MNAQISSLAKRTRFLPFTVLAVLLVALTLLVPRATAQLLNGRFTFTERWSVTLEYSDFGRGFTGTRQFTGTVTGTIEIENGQYELANKTGLSLRGAGSLVDRSIYTGPGNASISGSYVFAPAYGVGAYGIVFLGCAAVKVPLVDGEVPVFGGFNDFDASGPTLDLLSGYGNMRGVSLDVTVTSSISIHPRSMTPSAAPVITGQAKTIQTPYGRPVEFAPKVTGTQPIAYQWTKDGMAIEGATEPMLAIELPTTKDSGTYSLSVSNSFGSDTDIVATLEVLPPIAPAINLQPPATKAVKDGKPLKLAARAKGSAPLNYQWFFEGIAIDGAITNKLLVPAMTPDFAGSYLLIVTNVAGSATSRVSTVTVKPGTTR